MLINDPLSSRIVDRADVKNAPKFGAIKLRTTYVQPLLPSLRELYAGQGGPYSGKTFGVKRGVWSKGRWSRVGRGIGWRRGLVTEGRRLVSAGQVFGDVSLEFGVRRGGAGWEQRRWFGERR